MALSRSRLALSGTLLLMGATLAAPVIPGLGAAKGLVVATLGISGMASQVLALVKFTRHDGCRGPAVDRPLRFGLTQRGPAFPL